MKYSTLSQVGCGGQQRQEVAVGADEHGELHERVDVEREAARRIEPDEIAARVVVLLGKTRGDIRGAPAGRRDPDVQLVAPASRVPGVLRHGPVVVQVGPHGIPALQLAADAVDAGLFVQLLLEAAEQVVPEEEDADVVFVEIDIVLRVVDAVVGGSLDPAVENAEAADHPRVRPELVEELRHAHQQENAERHAAERHRHVENPVDERAGAGLPEGGGEIELLALMMDHVRCPEESHGVAEAVLPVVAEVVEDEGEDPGGPAMPGRRTGAQWVSTHW